MTRTTYYVFHSATTPDLRGITGDPDGATLPASDGPWTFERQIAPDESWTLDLDQAVVAFGIGENGFYLWGPIPQHASSKPVIESDRVEGTAVFDPQGHRIGTIKRLLIAKVSGRVVYVDVTFGGFLGLEQDLFLIIRRYHQPNAATFETRSIPPAFVRRISRPTAKRNTAGSCRAGGIRVHKVLVTSHPLRVRRGAWPMTTRCDHRKPISLK